MYTNKNTRFTRKPLKRKVTLKDMLQTTGICLFILFMVTTMLWMQFNLEQDLWEALDRLEQYEVNPVEQFIEQVDAEYNAPVEIEVEPSIYQDNQEEFIDIAVEVLTAHEWFASTAYCDNLIYTEDWRYVKHCPTWYERYSIGYGTKSHKGETITYQEWVARMRADIAVRGEELKELTCYTQNQKAAILDFYYNSGKYTKHNVTGIYFVYYVKNCNKEAIKGFLNPANYRSAGLKKRRDAEYYLFNK